MEPTKHAGHSNARAPGVTVLMPAHNAASTIDRAITSVLGQSCTDFELLIIDDGSTDDTAQRISRFIDDPRIRVLRNTTNLGLIASLNRGVGEAGAPLIARLDADDTAHSRRLAAQVHAMTTHPDAELCATGYRRMRPDGGHGGDRRPPPDHGSLAVALLAGNRIAHSTVMYRTETVRRLGGYSQEWFPAEDYDLWLRLLEEGTYIGVAELLVDYLENPAGISGERSSLQQRQEQLRAVRYRSNVLPDQHSGGSVLAQLRAEWALIGALTARLRTRGIVLDPAAPAVRQALHAHLRGMGRLRRQLLLSVAAPHSQLAALSCALSSAWSSARSSARSSPGGSS